MMGQVQKVLVVLVGLPGTGKSTFRKTFKDETLIKFVEISSDDWIDEFAAEKGKTYTEVFKEVVSVATTLANERANRAAANFENVVWDQTNLTVAKRKQILDKFNNYVKICITFEIPDEVEWLKRLYKRAGTEGKYIPYGILHGMIKTYQPPTLAEGFDLVMTREEYLKEKF